MKPCACTTPHRRKRIVLTGGPGAGKTAVAHTHRTIVPSTQDFLEKAARVVEILKGEMPECCKETTYASAASR
jgi:hypothetical protein